MFKVGDKVKVKYVPGLEGYYRDGGLFEACPHLRGVQEIAAVYSDFFTLSDDPLSLWFTAESLELVVDGEVEKPTVADLIAKAQALNKELEGVYKQIFAIMKEGDIENESW